MSNTKKNQEQTNQIEQVVASPCQGCPSACGASYEEVHGPSHNHGDHHRGHDHNHGHHHDHSHGHVHSHGGHTHSHGDVQLAGEKWATHTHAPGEGHGAPGVVDYMKALLVYAARFALWVLAESRKKRQEGFVAQMQTSS